MASLAHRFLTMPCNDARRNRWLLTVYALHAPGFAEPRIGKAMVETQPER